MDTLPINSVKIVLTGLIPIFLIFLLPMTSGVVFFIVFGSILILILLFLKYLGAFSPFFQRIQPLLSNFLLAAISILISLIFIESFLCTRQPAPKAPSKLVMPQEWKRRPVAIPGASYAYYWHDILHVHDKNRMRRSVSFPMKSGGKFRIMVVGDSLTYGYGVREEETYPSQIETMLKKKFDVEVLNLGVSGYQSEDVLKTVREYTPLLEPDLIIYGVCLNDFLPSGIGQYENNMAYKFPLPEKMKRFLSEKTSIGQLVNRAYNSLLMNIGLRNDFWNDILKDFKNYQGRFSQDVRNMNDLAIGMGRPPIIAMVLNQDPDLNSKGYQIAMAAERHLTNAGMTLIPTGEFYRNYDKQRMMVSPWEGHPSPKAHKIFAELFVAHLQHRQDLKGYRILK